MDNDKKDVKQLSQEELFTYSGGQSFIYYFPASSKITTRQHLLEDATKGGKKIAVKKGAKYGAKGFGDMVGKSLGPVKEYAEAGYTTYKSRSKENMYKDTGGTKGFSRTKANKEITSSWSSSAAGVAGAVRSSNKYHIIGA